MSNSKWLLSHAYLSLTMCSIVFSVTCTTGGYIPSGELTFCHGKSPCFMGKSTISMAIFHCYVSSPKGILHWGMFHFFLTPNMMIYVIPVVRFGWTDRPRNMAGKSVDPMVGSRKNYLYINGVNGHFRNRFIGGTYHI